MLFSPCLLNTKVPASTLFSNPLTYHITSTSRTCTPCMQVHTHYTQYLHHFLWLSQEYPNYSFLLPFAQYNLQCPGYYMPVLHGKWVYPHSNSTCRIWNKIISYSVITRDPPRSGRVVGREEEREVAFFGALAKGDVSSSISLASIGNFC